MARRRRRRRFGLPPEEHRDRARDEIREFKRLVGVLRSQLKDPPDCVHAFHLASTLAEVRGRYVVEDFSSGRRSGVKRGLEGSISRLLTKFEKKCVLHPKNRRASQRIHAVWR